MDFKTLGFLDNALLSSLQDMMDLAEEATGGASSGADTKQANAPSRAYFRDAKAMARTPADVKELPNSYQFVVDMPGVAPAEVKVQLEDDDGVLVVSGERKRDREDKDKDKEKEKEKEGVKYLRMERRMGKFMRKFALPENAKRDAISAVYKDGVLTVTVEKVPPPEPKKPKLIEVKAA